MRESSARRRPDEISVSEPLSLAFDVDCPVDHAFTVWTARLGSWWPADHTVSGRPERVEMECTLGGRIYERAADGVEHEWGRVTAWEPPTRLAYTWHLGRDPGEATDVEIRFSAVNATHTRVEIDHTGWSRLGATADEWRDRNRIGWQTLLPHFRTATTNGEIA
jgi:uncharacterized protein YndB with AHSA1/START domain